MAKGAAAYLRCELERTACDIRVTYSREWHAHLDLVSRPSTHSNDAVTTKMSQRSQAEFHANYFSYFSSLMDLELRYIAHKTSHLSKAGFQGTCF